jgi:hypothetical protein
MYGLLLLSIYRLDLERNNTQDRREPLMERERAHNPGMRNHRFQVQSTNGAIGVDRFL